MTTTERTTRTVMTQTVKIVFKLNDNTTNTNIMDLINKARRENDLQTQRNCDIFHIKKWKSGITTTTEDERNVSKEKLDKMMSLCSK
jgi:hypothetical protein